ncbi:lipid-A-disaccharide synthase [Lysobacteraceae bacterium NML75-0749]|nr:lipid-A-disaccharide synthase [Xanthomonadaceae bacterium NML75-0749]PJK04983.1 lipid-A-disaccharide synthase [Xanthomonadaceae bacterium NML91-0268]
MNNRDSGLETRDLDTSCHRPAPLRIALCAGEASGDILGARLIAALRQRYPNAQFAGIGGAQMRAAGLRPWHDAEALAVMGLAEVLAHLPRLLRLRKQFRQAVLDWQADIFIGIDAPDFNLGIEKWLKQRGLRTVHYVSPSVWAWRESRAAKMGESADRVLCLFPMEPPIYARHGVDAVFVGHPMADEIPLHPDRAAARARLGVDASAPVLALLPGSRLGEIQRMLPIFLAAARQIGAHKPGLEVLIPAASPACHKAITALITDSGLGKDGASTTLPNLRLLNAQAREAMIASDCVLLASGTAALEAMLCKRPMVIGHRISAPSYAIVKGLGLLKTAHVSLPNILAGKALVPEFLQDACTAENLAQAVCHLLDNQAARAALLPQFEAIHQRLTQSASDSAAAAVAELLGDAG